MADISINKFRTAITRGGATPATPGFAETEGQDPVNPSGSGTQYGVGAGVSLDSVNRIQLGKQESFTPSAVYVDLTEYGENNPEFYISTNFNDFWNGTGNPYATFGLFESSTRYRTDLNTYFNIDSRADVFIESYSDKSILNISAQSNLGSLGIVFDTSLSSAMVVTDLVNSKGLENAGDYESNFTARSLVTKQYVDEAVSGGTVSIGSPANGLSLSGTVLSLGLASSGVTGALSGTDWNTFNGKLGGTIASGQVAFGTGVNTVGGSSNITWDNTNFIFRAIGISLSFSGANRLINSHSDGGRLILNGGVVGGSVNNAEVQIGGASNTGAIAFRTGNLSRLYISPAGLIGLGNNESPTNTLDVNGTARIRTISNLGSTATRFLVASATGVVSERTGAELVSDLGISGGSNWTVGTGFIYRNGPVVVGDTTLPTNATFAVKSMTATATNKYLQFLNNSGAELVSLTQSGILLTTSPLANFGNATTNIATGGPTIKGGVVNGNSDAIFRVNSSGDTSIFEVRSGRGIVVSVTQSFFGGIPSSNIAAGGPTIKSGAINGNVSSIFNILNSAEGLVLEVRPNYLISYSPAAHFGNPTSGIATGAHFKGNANNTSVIFQIDNSSNTPLFRVRGNGDMLFSEGRGFEFGTVTGWKIGTATNQKLAFYNSTPIVQPSGDILTALSNLGLVASPTITPVDESTAKTTASADQTLPSGTLTILDYDTTVINNNTSIYTVGTTGRITVNSTGIYTITAGVVVEADAITALESAFLGIFRNGDLVAISSINTTIAAGAQSGLSTSTILSLTSGDIIDCRALVNSVGGVANGLARRLGTLLGANATQVNSLSISKSSQ